MRKLILPYFIILSFTGRSQSFPAIGQLPSTAFPVCGTSVFNQTQVPRGISGSFRIPGCGLYQDLGPFWYSFTCYESGTLGFTITPNLLSDDYDWMLFDITGHDPKDVYTTPSLYIKWNWSGSSGLTGAKKGASDKNQCASNPADHIPTFTSMPNLIKGHKYLLLVSHFTKTQSGYSLTFGGGTASIKDPLEPKMNTVQLECDRKTLTVSLNKQMRCNSLASNGSDFILSPSAAQITGASANECSNGFDMTKVSVTLSARLDAGNYSLFIRNGADGNTLLDDCGSQIGEGQEIDFIVQPPQPTQMDSLVKPACAADRIVLAFADSIFCSSIAPDGSDFKISGPTPVSVIGFENNCVSGLTNEIILQLNAPVYSGGNYAVTLYRGNDGNAIINRCGLETPPGATLPFTMKDTVNAGFTNNIAYGCVWDTIQVHYLPDHGVNSWEWFVDSSLVSTDLEPNITESVFGIRNVMHIVTNGFCSDTITTAVNLDNILKAGIESADFVCPKDLIRFKNTSIGHIVQWTWYFGDGSSSDSYDPLPHLYPNTLRQGLYTVSLVVQDNLGCLDTAIQKITKLQSCFVNVPNAFTPNGDGINDYLYPLNAYYATNLEFRVYNRFGQLVFETRDWTKKWDGTIGGKPQPSGTYVWTLRYTDTNSGTPFFLRGSSVLVR